MKLRLLPAALAAVFIAALAACAQAATMQCTPYAVFSGAPYPGTGPYTADADGIVTGVSANDVNALHAAGCMQVGVSGYTLLGRIVGANMNVTTDQKVPAAQWFVSASAGWIPAQLEVKDCSISLSAAQGTVYDAASKGGNALFGTTTSPYTACTGAGTTQPYAAVTAATKVLEPGTTLPVLSLTTAQGSAATANVYIYGYVLGQ